MDEMFDDYREDWEMQHSDFDDYDFDDEVDDAYEM